MDSCGGWVRDWVKVLSGVGTGSSDGPVGCETEGASLTVAAEVVLGSCELVLVLSPVGLMCCTERITGMVVLVAAVVDVAV